MDSSKINLVGELVDQFSDNEKQYLSNKYDEANTRVDFIDKFFEILDWDVRNVQGYSEFYREVVREDKVTIQGKPKAPDYSFRIGGVRKFFVEAKKPAVNIKEAVSPAYQLRRYAYTAKLPLSILTDFEEFAIYDTRLKPSQNDAASNARVFYCLYKDYATNFNFLYDTFSKPAILKGSFDKYVDDKKAKRGTSEVDKEFLKLIDEWRTEFAKNIALRNKDLEVFDLNYAVQKIIDRIIFLRIAEDRRMEDYGTLQLAGSSLRAYEKTCHLFRKANNKYNSGLFKVESWLDALTIDDKIIKNIIDQLYYPQCPYELSVMPIEILGNIYEQFLGKTIRLTPSHQAKIEEKPEVRKAGGVYYTPKYIVDYIVENTVGEKIKDQTPKQIESIKILDPACGSGSFLVGAYQYLLNYHTKYYTKEENLKNSLKKGFIYQLDETTYKLSIEEKQKILLNNIFGVDIDSQAVEVTKLSLLLKLMEDENMERTGQLFKYSDLKILPDLKDNIKCGNSLIGSDFYKDKNLELFSKEDMRKINAFDWEVEFKEIMKSGGFDCVIGNPPYVRQEMLGEYKDYFLNHYKVFASTADLYVYFFEKYHHLLKSAGLFSIICSNKFMRANYGKLLRDFLLTNTRIIKIVDFGELAVFEKASTFPAIYIISNTKIKNQKFIYAPIKRLNFETLRKEVSEVGSILDNKSLIGDNWTLAKKEEIEIIEKVKNFGVPLGEYTKSKIYRGVLTGLNEAFIIDNEKKEQLIRNDPNSIELLKPFVAGDDIRKYRIDYKNKYLIIIPQGWTKTHTSIGKDPVMYFKMKYPAIFKHLSLFEDKAKKRWDKGDFWWELRACVYYNFFEKPKIIFPDIAKESRMTYDTKGYFVGNTAYILPTEDLYLLAILNSKLIFNYFKRNSTVLGDADKGGRLRWIYQDVVKIPIHVIDFTSKKEKEIHRKLEFSVKKLLDLNLIVSKSINKQEKIDLLRQITTIDKQIDELIYELYGLTEKEIKIIENE